MKVAQALFPTESSLPNQENSEGKTVYFIELYPGRCTGGNRISGSSPSGHRSSAPYRGQSAEEEFESLGGEIRFETQLTDLIVTAGKVVAVVTSAGEIPVDVLVIAPGHSAHETYRMLIRNKVLF